MLCLKDIRAHCTPRSSDFDNFGHVAGCFGEDKLAVFNPYLGGLVSHDAEVIRVNGAVCIYKTNSDQSKGHSYKKVRNWEQIQLLPIFGIFKMKNIDQRL